MAAVLPRHERNCIVLKKNKFFSINLKDRTSKSTISAFKPSLNIFKKLVTS